MNIMKTNMLLLNNKRIMNEEAGNSTVQAPVPETKDPQKSMNALTFQGMKNVMANPQLSEIAFHGKFGSLAQTAKEGAARIGKFVPAAIMMGATILPGAMALTSCERDLKVSQETKVEVNLDALLAIADKMYQSNMLTLEELKALRADLNNWQKNQEAFNQAVITILTKMQNDILGISSKVDEGNAYHLIVINLLESQGYSHDQAISMLQQIIDMVAKQGKSVEEAMQELIRQLNLVNNKLDTIIDNQDRAYDEQTKQTNILKSINANTAETAQQVKQANAELKKNRQTMIMCNNQMLAKLDKLDADVIKSSKDVINYMKKMNIDIQNNNNWNSMMITAAINYNTNVTQQGNDKLDELKALYEAGLIQEKEYAEKMLEAVENTNKKMDLLNSLVSKYGSRLSATANAALAELIKGNLKQDRANYLLRLVLAEIKDLDSNVQEKLQAILDKTSTSGNISQEDIDTIIALLQNIDANVETIKTTVEATYKLLQEESKKNDVFRTSMMINGHINTQIALDNNRLLRDNNKTLNNMDTHLVSLNEKVDSLIKLGNEKPDELKAEIERLRQENSAWLAKIDIDQNMGNAAIINQLRKFQNTYIKTERQEIALEKEQNALIEKAIALLKNPTGDNKEVLVALQAVVDAINAGKEDITAELKAANVKLDALLEKVGEILDAMGQLATTLKVYGDQIVLKLDKGNEEILKQLKANGAKIDVTNLNLSELKAEVEKIKPELEKLNKNASTANGYLDIISKKQIEMDQHIQNINGGGNGGITVAELDSLWNIHDANAFAKAKAYMDALQIQNMDKADEIISYIKAGNLTAGNIYTLLLNFANKTDLSAEQLRALLQAVYDYLPELICKCNCSGDCNNNTNHEGIIGNLIN